MKKIIVLYAFVCLTCTIVAQTLRLPQIAAYPKPWGDMSWFCDELLAKGQPGKVLAPNELDVRTCDISSWDFTNYTADELADVLTFDSKTKFPPKNKLPKGFNPKQILKHAKNPGLGISALHKKGITGKGVSIAVIDQNMLIGHQEYPNNVLYYEEDKFWQLGQEASMHAPAVVSIAAGKTVGIAPKASVFEFAPGFGENWQTDKRYDARPTAAALRRITELNTQLPPAQKIRVVSISRGFSNKDVGADEFQAAAQALAKDGVAVFTTNDVFTLSRNHSADNPDNRAAYCRPAYWFSPKDVTRYFGINAMIVPTDFRTTAAPTGKKDYVHYANGGLSWAVPYVAGLYALGVQVYPGLTKEIFIQKALETATDQHCTYQGVDFSAKLVNPAKLLVTLKELNTTQTKK